MTLPYIPSEDTHIVQCRPGDGAKEEKEDDKH